MGVSEKLRRFHSSIHVKLANDPRFFRYFPDSSEANPGPGAYNVGRERVSNEKTVPAFSLRGRVEYNPPSLSTPGPGAYQIDGANRKGFTMVPRRDVSCRPPFISNSRIEGLPLTPSLAETLGRRVGH